MSEEKKIDIIDPRFIAGLVDQREEELDALAEMLGAKSETISYDMAFSIAAGDINGRLTPVELVEDIAELVRIFNAGTYLYYELGGEAESKEVAKALHCKQETVRRLWGLWPKQEPEINPGDLSDATEGLI